jgi:hypothetical protein
MMIYFESLGEFERLFLAVGYCSDWYLDALGQYAELGMFVALQSV